MVRPDLEAGMTRVLSLGDVLAHLTQIVSRWFAANPTEWDFDRPMLTSHPLLDDGQSEPGDPLMRRRLPDGSWQYRRETPEEEWERVRVEAW